MRRSSIDSFRESLLKIKHDVHNSDDDDDHQMIIRNRADDDDGEDDSISDRRISHQFAQSKSKSPLLRTPTSNGFEFDSSSKHRDDEIQQYKVELQRLQESESQIKALSINYAALLKEKEDQMSKLRDENGSLRKNLEVSRNGSYTSTNESNGTLTSKKNSTKAVYEKSSGGKLYRQASQTKTASSELGNGIHIDGLHQNNEKELSRVMEDHKITLKTLQAKYESEIKDLKMEFSKERDKFASMQLKFEEEDRLSRSLRKELLTFKLEKDQHTSEMKAMQNELNGKISEIKRLQMELSRRDTNEGDETSESLKRVIMQLERENSNLKMEKGKLETALKVAANSSSEKSGSKGLEIANKDSSKLNEVNASNILEKEKMEQTIQKLENDLNSALQGKDKALQELKRLKQHLLDKELEESDKMDEDSRVIEDLKATVSHQRSQLLHLEKSLRQALENEETARKSNVGELQKSKETIHQLEEKLASCVKTLEAKNNELSNLQVALGQYYAESEAKERLERDLVHAREETARLSESVKNANLEVEMQKHKTEEILIKLSQSERMVLDGKNTLRKLEEDNIKLRRALEQSMTRLNRMSMDSDYFVDRRIVIKLLVTYFQRNHSKEVLDLMVRMLGFSEEDKQRIGGAQQGTGKGVVRGVLGFPGRLVGGILGSGGPTDGSVPSGPSDNQSFADLWVDFLLKETQERERRELMETTTSGPNDDDKMIKRPTITEPPSFMVTQPEQSESEFSTVPLTSSVSPYPDNRSRVSRY